jgi:hypothetical protein
VLHDVREFVTSGSLIIPAGVTRVLVELWGAGGGGGGSGAGDCVSIFGHTVCFLGPSGAGGGGSAYVRAVVKVTPGSTYAIVIGTGGIGGTGQPSDHSVPPGTGGTGTPTQIKFGSTVLAAAAGGHGAGLEGGAGGLASTIGISRAGLPGNFGTNISGGTAGHPGFAAALLPTAGQGGNGASPLPLDSGGFPQAGLNGLAGNAGYAVILW